MSDPMGKHRCQFTFTLQLKKKSASDVLISAGRRAGLQLVAVN
jgi:hypothetical protein